MLDLLSPNALASISSDDLIPFVVIVGGVSFAIIATIMSAIVSTVRAKENERSRREIAAYVAEGSMTADEGERLIRAASASNTKACAKQI